MGDKTGIEWTDATWNPITGCSVVSPGCTNCYAMKLAGGRMKSQPNYVGLTQDTKAGPVWTGAVRLNERALERPLHWRKPRRIFVNSMSDLFHESVPEAWIDRIFAIMALSPQHQFQVLTKRPERMREYMANSEQRIAQLVSASGRKYGWQTRHNADYETVGFDGPCWPLPNVWLGVSVEDNMRLGRVRHLLQTDAMVRFISFEPLLSNIRLSDVWVAGDTPKINWVICGGESGPGARPMHPDWVRSLRDQCHAAGVPFFFKQWGEWLAGENYGWPKAQWQDGETGQHSSSTHPNGRERDPGPEWRHFGTPGELGAFTLRVGKKAAGNHLDGTTHMAFPVAA